VFSNDDLAGLIVGHAGSEARAALAGANWTLHDLVDERRYQYSEATLNRYIDGIRSLGGASRNQLKERQDAVRATINTRLENGI
jgi:hypothetical protein